MARVQLTVLIDVSEDDWASEYGLSQSEALKDACGYYSGDGMAEVVAQAITSNSAVKPKVQVWTTYKTEVD